jgi:peptidoglycan/LPS O-acetylase OafA/YrhL
MSGLRADTGQARTRLAALDGFRALAITIIVLFHFHLRDGHLVPGAYAGVDMFFALSGFLITTSLLVRYERGSRNLVRHFYSRRVRRLYPALVLFLLVWLAAAWLFGQSGWFNVDSLGPRLPAPHQDFGEAVNGALLTLTLALNWVKTAHVATPLLLGPLWYIAAQEQFYIVWVPVLALCLRRSRELALTVAAGGALASFLLTLFLWQGGKGADHIYFGADARAQAPLIGAAAALAWTNGWFHALPHAVRQVLAALGSLTLALLVFHFWGDVIKFRSGFAIGAIASVAVITYLLDGAGRTVTGVLSAPPIVWLGRRSYAIFLWNFPIACWTHRMPALIGVPLGLAATGVVAELSWRLVESRFVSTG